MSKVVKPISLFCAVMSQGSVGTNDGSFECAGTTEKNKEERVSQIMLKDLAVDNLVLYQRIVEYLKVIKMQLTPLRSGGSDALLVKQLKGQE